MSFAEWKKKTKLFDGTTIIASSGDSLLFHDHVNGIAQAAYKAGERQGRKDAEYIADAERYRFLRDLNGIELRTVCQGWIRPDGSRFNASHYFAGNDTAFTAYETLDETIDAAMKVKK